MDHNRIEVRVDVKPDADMDVCFWQDGRRSDTVHLSGDEEEYWVGFYKESISAWAELVICKTVQIENGRTVWNVYHRTNVVKGDKLHVVLEGIEQRIEAAIRNGVSTSLDITEDLRILGMEIRVPIN